MSSSLFKFGQPTQTLDSTDGGSGYYHEIQLNAANASPGGSGATLSVIGTSTLAYLLDATTEYIYFGADIHDDWDAASDIIVQVSTCLENAETANDIINAELVAEYFGDRDVVTSAKTQTRTVNHDIGSDNGQHAAHILTFVLDHNLADNAVEIGDTLMLRFRLDSVAGGTDVAGIYVHAAHILYRTTYAQVPRLGVTHTEG